MSKQRGDESAFGVVAGSEVFVIFARTAFNLGESVVVEWWPVGSTTDRAIAEAAVAGNRHARIETFPAHEQNLGTTPAGVAASSDAADECSCAGSLLPNTH